MKQYGSWQEMENTEMLAEYLSQPEQWYRHHYRYANSVVHRIALGERLVKSEKQLEDLQYVATNFVGALEQAWLTGFRN